MRKTISLVLILTLGLTTEVARADFVFGTPKNLGSAVNTSFHDAAGGITPDGLSLFLDSDRSGAFDIWVTTRATTDDNWGTPEKLAEPLNSNFWDGTPSLSADGLSLFFCSDRPGGSGGNDIWVSTRASLSDTWGEPENLGPTVNSPNQDWTPDLSADGLSLYFCSDRPEGLWDLDLWVSTRATVSEPWGEPVNLGPTVNSSAFDMGGTVTPNGLVLFFTSTRPGGLGDRDLWMTRRATTSDPWQEPVNLGSPINTLAMDTGTVISPDGSTLYFASMRPGGYGGLDVYQVPITTELGPSSADLNGDGMVNMADFCRLAQYWFGNEQSIDIAPPIRDAVVDFKDLVVLAENWLADFRLIAHWTLDETEGTIAHDSISENDGTLHGEPVWQPADGQIDGALQLNGIDDYVSAGSPLGTMDLSLSVFAWIKGGAPGEVIISQRDGTMPGATWLGTDPSEGKLITTLLDPFFPPLESDSVITDDQWHHIGLVYDFYGYCRRLYVDGAEVAKDTTVVAGLLPDGGLYFGAGKDVDPASFFSGLMDDVRIYNVALSAEEIEELAR
jgi:hypothetical protein